MKILFIAGETSGDNHAARLITALKQIDADIDISFMGGDAMALASLKAPILHIKDAAFMGFYEVLKNFITIRNNFKVIKHHISHNKPDCVVFVDYPGFNLRLAPWVKSLGLRTVYYITPSVWAWHTSRVYDIKKYIDVVIPILPFEPAFFAKFGVKGHYCGNPVFEDFMLKSKHSAKQDKSIIALLPGSRNQEIKALLPVMIDVANALVKECFVILKAPLINKDVLNNYLEQNIAKNIEIFEGSYFELLQKSKAAVVASGTATLETALMQCPQVVVYKTSFVTYQLAKVFAKVKYISLVNLILDKSAVEELIQLDCNKENILLSLSKLLNQKDNKEAIKICTDLALCLGEARVSEKVAERIISST